MAEDDNVCFGLERSGGVFRRMVQGIEVQRGSVSPGNGNAVPPSLSAAASLEPWQTTQIAKNH